MRFSKITIIVFVFAVLMGNSASFAKTGDNNQAQEKLLIGSWYMPQPFVVTEQGVTISLNEMKVRYLENGTSEGSSSMHFVAGDGVEAMKEMGMSLTYHIEAVTNWSLNDGVITDTLTKAVVTPGQSNMVSNSVAASMVATMKSESPVEYEIVLVSQTILKLKDVKSEKQFTYTRVAD